MTFWFQGNLDYINNPSNALPTGIALGTPFSGRVTYNLLPGTYITGFTNASGSRSNAYFSTLAGVSTVLHIGGHTITNTMTDPERNVGTLHINDNFDNEDAFTFYTGFTGLAVDGTALTNCYWSLYLSDRTKTAYTSAAFPSIPPILEAFPSRRTFMWSLQAEDNSYMFSVVGPITAVSPTELVVLTFRSTGPTTGQLAWPAAATGFTLQSTANIASGPWKTVADPVVDIGAEHTVNVSTKGTPLYYRLRK